MAHSNPLIHQELDAGDLAIEHPEGAAPAVGPSSVDLHLHDTIITSEPPDGGVVKVDDGDTYPEYHEKDGLRVEPGEFVLASTREYVEIPPHLMALMDGRSSVGRLGLQVENAGLVDAGFAGQLTLELANDEDFAIELVPDMAIVQLSLHEHDEAPPVDYSNQGKYQGQEGPVPSKLYEDFEQ